MPSQCLAFDSRTFLESLRTLFQVACRWQFEHRHVDLGVVGGSLGCELDWRVLCQLGGFEGVFELDLCLELERLVLSHEMRISKSN